ncbi:hypothetical protein Bpfe_013685 [Biomphalaria pfeifferi]|uniref:Uncharacterized protein n=1 Tax=Biomphalaria pfeifferi TaxID=112525 RepID=A0AAD8FAU3_BIOPF|nr:hypothetical protein Bpfe_013685 [Biomphalaria pfeifferi]
MNGSPAGKGKNLIPKMYSLQSFCGTTRTVSATWRVLYGETDVVGTDTCHQKRDRGKENNLVKEVFEMGFLFC